MNEKEILSVSLASLLKIYPPQAEDIAFEGCFLGHREGLEHETAMNLFRFPTRINSFGIVFCSKGSIRITADLKHCTLVSHTMFVCPPGRIVQVESQEKASVFLILCEEEFINRIHIDMKQLLHLFMAVREHPSGSAGRSTTSSGNVPATNRPKIRPATAMPSISTHSSRSFRATTCRSAAWAFTPSGSI